MKGPEWWSKYRPKPVDLIKNKNIKLCWRCIVDIIVLITQRDDLYSKNCLRFVLILFFQLRRRISSCLVPLDFQTKIVYQFLSEQFLEECLSVSRLTTSSAVRIIERRSVTVYGLYQGFENHCFNIKKLRARVHTNTQRQHDELISLLFFSFLGRKVG